jgi:uncharacterized membrane protein YdjX (TVP38/TMEM64 family)
MYFLLGILALTIIGTFCLVWFGKAGAEAFTQTVLPLLTTLVGTALGFYFGGKDREDDGPDGSDIDVTEQSTVAESSPRPD